MPAEVERRLAAIISADVVGLRLRRVHHRRLFTQDRGLACVELASMRPGAGRARAGAACTVRSRRPGAPQRSRRAVRLDPLHRAACRGKHRVLGRQCRRLVRQRTGRDDQRPLQDRGHPPAGSVARRRRRRVRHPGLGRLVQREEAAQLDREYSPFRVRTDLLSLGT